MMLLPSECTEFEIVGAYRVTNPPRVVALAEEMRRAAAKRRELTLLGLTLWEAIERALKGKGSERKRAGLPAARCQLPAREEVGRNGIGGDDRRGQGALNPVVAVPIARDGRSN